MKRRDILTITSVACATAVITVAAFFAPSLDAGGENHAPSAKIAKPKLLAHGVEFSLAAKGNGGFKANDEPVFELTAVNTTQEAQSVNVGLTMTSSSVADLTSRAIRMPASLWQKREFVALKPSETRTIELAPGVKLPANRIFTVLLNAADQKNFGPAPGSLAKTQLPAQAGRPFPPTIVALSFSTGTNALMPAIVSLR